MDKPCKLKPLEETSKSGTRDWAPPSQQHTPPNSHGSGEGPFRRLLSSIQGKMSFHVNLDEGGSHSMPCRPTFSTLNGETTLGFCVSSLAASLKALLSRDFGLDPKVRPSGWGILFKGM